ncbi:hypothetical protein ACMGL1_03105, partial [Enterobacter cloacae]
GKNSLNRLIRCVCGKKIGPDPRNFNQRVSLGRNDLLIRTFPNGECTANSDKSQSRDLKQLSREAEAVMNGTIDDGAAFLLGQGWKPNNGKWHKQGYTLTLVVEKGIVVNSQLSK